MKDVSPTLEEWKQLYDAAIAFKKIKCWEWMGDTDIFGVQNPENGEVGYCSILGNLGEVYALAVYLGTEGLITFSRIASGEFFEGNEDIMYIQKCLMASFESRQEVTEEDLKVIRKLGLRFRGANAWPVFRSYEPGYVPWYLTGSQARFLTVALQQAKEVALRFKGNPKLLIPPDKGVYFVRVPEKKGDGFEWKDRWLRPAPGKVKKKQSDINWGDEVYLRRLLKSIRERTGAWEVDCFYAPIIIKEGPRPYYPYICLWVDNLSGMIMMFHLLGPHKDRTEFLDKTVELIERIEMIPQDILVQKAEVFKLFRPLAQKLKINLMQVDVLMQLEEARQGMFSYLNL